MEVLFQEGVRQRARVWADKEWPLLGQNRSPGREGGRDGLQFGESSSSLPRGGSLLHQIAVHHPTGCLVTHGWCPWQHFYTNNAGQPFTSWPPKFCFTISGRNLSLFVCVVHTWLAHPKLMALAAIRRERDCTVRLAADAALTSTQLQIRNLDMV